MVCHIRNAIRSFKKVYPASETFHFGGISTSQQHQTEDAKLTGSTPVHNDTLDSTLTSTSWFMPLLATIVAIIAISMLAIMKQFAAAVLTVVTLLVVLCLASYFSSLRKAIGNWLTTCTDAAISAVKRAAGTCKNILFVGHSHGCLLAHEVAKRLRSEAYVVDIITTGSPVFHGATSSMGDYVHPNDPVSNWSIPGMLSGNFAYHAFSSYLNNPNLVNRSL
jgi:hypothetical protein